jgi:plastocyanin
MKRQLNRQPRSSIGWRAATLAAGCAAAVWLCAPACAANMAKPARYYLPGVQDSKIVTVTKEGNASAEVTVLTQAVAVKETGPKATIERFGEVYAFAPSLVAVHRDEPTMITFWNLQPDDQHDFSIVDAKGKPLMDLPLAPLSRTSFIFTFHRPGIFQFRCLVHQPAMSGQILVLPPAE